MSEKASSRYQRLAIEGVVIVISILLAFGIDAMWEERQLRLEEEDALIALRADFTDNLEQIDSIIEAHLLFRERVATLAHLSPGEIRALPQKTISEYMLALANPWTFNAITGTTDALLSSGKLGLLREQELREALITFRGMLSDMAEDTAYITRGAEDFWKYEYRHGGPWTDPETETGYSGDIGGLDFIPRATAEDLINVRADLELMGRSKRYHINVGYYLSELGRIRNQITQILDLLGSGHTEQYS